MELALRYKDEKSDKFWRVETDGCVMLTNWGKTGTNGRRLLTEYATKEGCEREAEKLAASKKKKGYSDMLEFDKNVQTYLDTAEYGPHPLTSHPLFRKYFTADFYYDCGDEDAPFGSDEGNDTLAILQERVKDKMNFADFPRRLIEDEWEMTYLPPVNNQTDEELKTQAAQIINGLPGEQEILQTDQVIIATALGQIKITGKSDRSLLELALQSLNRRERMYRLVWGWTENNPPYNIAVMRNDLECFIKENLKC